MPEQSLDRRTFLTGAASVAAAAAQTPTAAQRPNILHIMIGPAAVGHHRRPVRLPHAESEPAGAAGTPVRAVYTPSAVCCPARAMLLSGAYHWHNGVYNQVHSPPSVHRDMNPDVVLYSQRLRDAGYRLGYVGKWHASVSCGTPLDFGFHEVAAIDGCDPATAAKARSRIPIRAARRTAAPEGDATERRCPGPGASRSPCGATRKVPRKPRPSIAPRNCAIRMMTALRQGHAAVAPGSPLRRAARPVPAAEEVSGPLRSAVDSGAEELRRHASKASPACTGASRRRGAHVTEDDVRQSRAHYYAYTEQLDAQIGRLLDALDKTGQADDTLVVFTTDHGDMVGAHRMWIKGWIPYEECYRVPMIVRWPGKTQAGPRPPNLVQTHDLAHTYVAAAGAQALPYAGRAFVAAAVRDPGAARLARTRFSAPITAASSCIRSGWRLRTATSTSSTASTTTSCTIWSATPDEMRNVVNESSYEKWTADMRARLYEMMARFHDPYGDSPEKYGSVVTGDRYCAARYLPRGRRA